MLSFVYDPFDPGSLQGWHLGTSQRYQPIAPNPDEQGRLRLNCIGTIEDLAEQQTELENGQRLTPYSEDLEVDGVVQFSEEEKI